MRIASISTKTTKLAWSTDQPNPYPQPPTNSQLLNIKLSRPSHHRPSYLINTSPTTQHPLKQQDAIKSASTFNRTQIPQLHANEYRSHINWHSLVLKLKITIGKRYDLFWKMKWIKIWLQQKILIASIFPKSTRLA